MIAHLTIDVEEAHKITETLSEELWKKLPRDWQPRNDIEYLYKQMSWVLGNPYLPKEVVCLENRERFIKAVREHPDIYDVLNNIFFSKFPMTKRYQQVLNILKSFLKELFEDIANSSHDDRFAIFNKHSNKLILDLGIQYPSYYR